VLVADGIIETLAYVCFLKGQAPIVSIPIAAQSYSLAYLLDILLRARQLEDGLALAACVFHHSLNVAGRFAALGYIDHRIAVQGDEDRLAAFEGRALVGL
jgi:hypothetical protein